MDQKKKKVMVARDHRVIQSNELIQRTRHALTVQEQKIILFVISKIKPDDTELYHQEINIQEFCSVCGIDPGNGANYIYLKRVIKKLSDKSFWMRLDNGDEALMRWIDDPVIKKGSGTITVQLKKNLMPFLLQLKKNFAEFRLVHALPMKSRYSIRLYELLKSVQWQRDKEFTIDELRALMFAQQYLTFKDFRKNVLDVALSEIEQFTDIKVTHELKKEGKKYSAIVFHIQERKDPIERLRISRAITDRLDGPPDDDQLSLW